MDMFNEMGYECRDVFPAHEDLLVRFLGVDPPLSIDDVHLAFLEAKLAEDEWARGLEMLLWYSFLGVTDGVGDHYSYGYSYSVPHVRAMNKQKESGASVFVVHPAFHSALGIHG